MHFMYYILQYLLISYFFIMIFKVITIRIKQF